jgi:hypothetical protein
MRQPSTKSLIKECDRLMSLFIRQSNANQFGQVQCSTCGFSYPWKQIQNGHFQSRRYYSTRWQEKNCAPQCARCNCWGNTSGSGVAGESERMAKWLDHKWGEGTADLQRLAARKFVKLSVPYLQTIKTELTEKLESNGYETK